VINRFKKSIPYLLIVLFVGYFSYYFFIVRKPPQEQSMALDWDELDSTGSAPNNVPASIKTNSKESKAHEREFSNVTKDEEDRFEEYDAMEKKWLSTVEGIIGPAHYPRYLEMREVNEKEKMQAYKEYHDYLRQKYGDKFNYNISEDQSVREKEINQRYLKDLLKLIGEQKFQAYISARDKINEENRKSSKEFIQVEF